MGSIRGGDDEAAAVRRQPTDIGGCGDQRGHAQFVSIVCSTAGAGNAKHPNNASAVAPASAAALKTTSDDHPSPPAKPSSSTVSAIRKQFETRSSSQDGRAVSLSLTGTDAVPAAASNAVPPKRPSRRAPPTKPKRNVDDARRNSLKSTGKNHKSVASPNGTAGLGTKLTSCDSRPAVPETPVVPREIIVRMIRPEAEIIDDDDDIGDMLDDSWCSTPGGSLSCRRGSILKKSPVNRRSLAELADEVTARNGSSQASNRAPAATPSVNEPNSDRRVSNASQRRVLFKSNVSVYQFESEPDGAFPVCNGTSGYGKRDSYDTSGFGDCGVRHQTSGYGNDWCYSPRERHRSDFNNNEYKNCDPASGYGSTSGSRKSRNTRNTNYDAISRYATISGNHGLRRSEDIDTNSGNPVISGCGGLSSHSHRRNTVYDVDSCYATISSHDGTSGSLTPDNRHRSGISRTSGSRSSRQNSPDPWHEPAVSPHRTSDRRSTSGHGSAFGYATISASRSSTSGSSAAAVRRERLNGDPRNRHNPSSSTSVSGRIRPQKSTINVVSEPATSLSPEVNSMQRSRSTGDLETSTRRSGERPVTGSVKLPPVVASSGHRVLENSSSLPAMSSDGRRGSVTAVASGASVVGSMKVYVRDASHHQLVITIQLPPPTPPPVPSPGGASPRSPGGYSADSIVVKANRVGNRLRVVSDLRQQQQLNELLTLPVVIDPYHVSARLEKQDVLVIEAPIVQR